MTQSSHQSSGSGEMEMEYLPPSSDKLQELSQDVCRPQKMRLADKIIHTINLYLAFFEIGLVIAIPGPTLLDLRCQVDTTEDKIPFIFIARSTGYVVGSVLGGLLYDKVAKPQLLMLGAIFFTTGLLSLIPWTLSLELLCAAFFFAGIFTGSIDTGGNVVILSLWEERNPPFMQALHLTFGLGALVAPLIVAPFLAGKTTSCHPIWVPYLMLGCFAALVFLLQLVALRCCAPVKRRDREIINDSSPTNKTLTYSLCGMAALLMFCCCGMEIVLGQLLPTYASIGPPQFSRTNAAYLTSTFWGTYTASRAVAACLAARVSTAKMLGGSLSIMLLGACIFAIWINPIPLWIGTAILGMGTGPIFGALIAWLEQQVSVGGRLSAIMVSSAALGEAALPPPISYLMKIWEPSLLLSALTLTLLAFAIYPILLYLAKRLYRHQHNQGSQAVRA